MIGSKLMISRMVTQDLEDFQQDSGIIENILLTGWKGYNDMTTEELTAEYKTRNFDDDVDIIQCCTCESVFNIKELTKNKTCPCCYSGNWVFGYIDE